MLHSGGTRTCIHTPGPPFETTELDPAEVDEALRDASLVYCDGRLTEVAIEVARAARSRGAINLNIISGWAI